MITKADRIHPLGNMNICIKFHGNPSDTVETIQAIIDNKKSNTPSLPVDVNTLNLKIWVSYLTPLLLFLINNVIKTVSLSKHCTVDPYCDSPQSGFVMFVVVTPLYPVHSFAWKRHSLCRKQNAKGVVQVSGGTCGVAVARVRETIGVIQ